MRLGKTHVFRNFDVFYGVNDMPLGWKREWNRIPNKAALYIIYKKIIIIIIRSEVYWRWVVNCNPY